jgi:nucleotide-binding universal stress UspA family protein
MTAPSLIPKQPTIRYSQIVVPVDFSPLSWRVLTLAKRMARAFVVPLRVVHVDTSSPWLDEGINPLVLHDESAHNQVDIDVVAARTPVEGILRVLGDDEGSLLVMSTHGHSAAMELATGSTAEDLLRSWHGPMLLAGPHYRTSPVPYRRIVVCVDPASTAASSAIVEDVKAWAAAFDIPVEVLAIVDATPSSDFEAVLNENERLEAVAAALTTDDRIAKAIRLEGKRPGLDIARYVDAVDGTLVAFATHARQPSARVVLGSIAMSVLRHVTSPALVRRFPTR